MHKIVVMAAVQKAHSYHNNSNAPGDAGSAQSEYNGSSSTSKNDRLDTDVHGNVNILLGGAMISGVIMMVVLICYCCHKNVRKHRPQEYSHYWRTEPDVHSLEVFTMDAHAMCLERSAGTQTHQEEGVPVSLPPCPVTSGPPPAYESLIFDPRALLSPTDKKDESGDSDIISPSVGNLPSESEANRINKREEVPSNDQGLPSYEAALKLEADGYV
ncbi:uncharacterized protein s-cup isoform X2 [Linepithema humile]|uniref:uncharacterized protein s-cup isoform X2 n=1 Tax=Linepithema humile TaxID=83485 RepID=UPI0006232047|nr:PREDICTED: uncharacterized protein LOC105674159 isoform X2 [Linepithema humile]